ncbi:MAG TPA: M56 family metallopeptidase [Oscillospiraceae bacterium]|nr:M56 family metallopeptidase [Oscillospiraceae bacterium]
MESVFLKLLNMSITASWLILAVLALRFLLRSAPKSIRSFLWALVGIRLIFPFSWQSVLSLIPSAETVSPDILYAEVPAIHSGINVLNQAVNPVISASLAPTAGAGVNPMQVVAHAAAIAWMAGMAALALYGAVSYIRLRRRVADAVLLRDNLWQSEKTASPFVLGLFRPRIYLPFDMEEESLAYVVAHERAHIKRRDHWIKPIGFLLLTVYWFNPLIWLAYVLLCRDIELACDERVVKEMGAADKKAYSEALLLCSVPHRMIAACPLAFGEVGVKERIRNVLSYQKPAFLIIIVALVSCVVAAACFLTNPKEETGASPYQWTQRVTAGDVDTCSVSVWDEDGGESSFAATDEQLEALIAILNTVASDEVYTGRGIPAQVTVTLRCGESEYLLRYGGDIVEIDFDSGTAQLYGEGIWQIENDALRNFMNGLTDESGSPATAYVSQSCLYMNPLSSALPDSESGLRYLIGADSVTIMSKQTGDAVAVSSPVGWDWQPISEAEWQALFPLSSGAPEIGGYQNPQVMELSSRYYLFNMDGALWFGQYNGEETGMWSVYSLAEESGTGVTWEYTPALSSRVPAFPFRFSLAYTRIEAACTGGRLIGFDDYDGAGYPQGEALSIPAGSALYWSPAASDADPAVALTAQIRFTVYNGDEAVSTGAVSISGTAGTGAAAATYNALLSEGDGLMLIQAPDADGALIQAAGSYPASPVDGIGWPQHLEVAQADLDGDGDPESVTVTKTDDFLYALRVLKADGSELWSEELSTAHAGWDSLFLCTLDGRDYLLRYNPAMFQGDCSYRYTLFTLENGQENVGRTGAAAFDVNGTNPLNVDEMTAFADEVNALLEKSVLLLSTQGGIVSVGPSDASAFMEDYAVLFDSGASNLAEAAVIRAAQIYVRNGWDFNTITNFYTPGFEEIDASRFAGTPLFTTDYGADGPLYAVTFETTDDAVLGPIILFVDSHGTVFGSSGRD